MRLVEGGQHLFGVSRIGDCQHDRVAADPLRQRTMALEDPERNGKPRLHDRLSDIPGRTRAAHTQHGHRLDSGRVGEVLDLRAQLPRVVTVLGKGLDRSEHVQRVELSYNGEIIEIGHGFWASSMSITGMSSRTG
jgi:hypothetical protein